jgi:bacillithiol system protein YtxJ
MGLFDGIFNKNKEEKVVAETFINWIPLTTLIQLEAIKIASETEAVLIFKHSTRCGISRIVIKQFEKLFTAETKNLKVYYLDLLNYRAVSDEVGYLFQVTHQSPQLIVVRNGVAVAHSSHNEITETNLSKFQ